MASYKILFIDDDSGILRSLGSHLERLGHAVFRAVTGE